MAYQEISTTNTTTFIPSELPEGEISVLVFYPGIEVGGKLGKDYMPPLLKDAVPEWFDKYVIVVPNTHKKKWETVKDEYEGELNVRKLKTANINIGVYSGSGQNSADITKSISSISGLSNVMLMDPASGSILENAIKDVRNKEVPVYMMYNPRNWSGGGFNATVRDSFTRLPNYVGTANAVDTKSSVYDHNNLPTSFLKNFKDKIQQKLVSDFSENTEESPTKKKVEKLDSRFTFNVEKEDIFLIVSSGQSGTQSGSTSSSGIASEIGQLMIVEDTELFVFQDEGEEFLDEEFVESEFQGADEALEDSEVDVEVAQAADTFEKTTTYTPSGKYDLDLIPGTYLDNNKNPIQLCRIDSSLVNVKIAEQYLQMRDAAKAAGINLSISSAFRSPFDGISTKSSKGKSVFASSQDYLYTSYLKQKEGKSSYVYNGTDKVRKGKTIKLGGFNLAAKPGRSNHGSGIGLDLNAGGKSKARFSGVKKEIYIWLVKNSWKFGFVRAVSNEEWHFDYLPEKAKLGPYGKIGNGKPQKDTGSTKTKFYSKWALDTLQGPDWGSTVNIEQTA